MSFFGGEPVLYGAPMVSNKGTIWEVPLFQKCFELLTVDEVGLGQVNYQNSHTNKTATNCSSVWLLSVQLFLVLQFVAILSTCNKIST